MSNECTASPWDTPILFTRIDFMRTLNFDLSWVFWMEISAKTWVTFIPWFTSCENSTYMICQGFSHYTLARTHYIDVHNRHFLHLAHFYSLHPLIFNASPLPFYPLFCNTTLSIILESNRHFLYPILSHHIHGPTLLLHFNPLSHSQCCLLILWYQIYYVSAFYIFSFSDFQVLLILN